VDAVARVEACGGMLNLSVPEEKLTACAAAEAVMSAASRSAGLIFALARAACRIFIGFSYPGAGGDIPPHFIYRLRRTTSEGVH